MRTLGSKVATRQGARGQVATDQGSKDEGDCGVSTNLFDRPISEIALFPAETEPTQNFDPKKRVKRWADPNPAGVGINVVYQNALALDEFGNPIRLADGQAALEPMVMTKDEARTLNIPPQEWEVTGTLPAWPTPLDLKKLGETERIVVQGFSNIAVIRDMAKYEEESKDPSKQLDRIEALLKKIAAKVGA
jgi:hypothetical protein